MIDKTKVSSMSFLNASDLHTDDYVPVIDASAALASKNKRIKLREAIELYGGTRPYKVYTALLKQNLNGPVVPNVLENDIGEVMWQRASEGRYFMTGNAGIFTPEKTFVMIGGYAIYPGTIHSLYGICYTITENMIGIQMISQIDNTPKDLNSQQGYVPDGLPIEVRVYN